MAIKHDLPEFLYVREDDDLEGEHLLVAEKTIEDALPDDSRPASVGIYKLVQVLRVARSAKILAKEDVA